MVFECNFPEKLLDEILKDPASSKQSSYKKQQHNPDGTPPQSFSQNLTKVSIVPDSLKGVSGLLPLRETGYRFYNAGMTPDKTHRCCLYIRDSRPDEKPAEKIKVKHHKYDNGRIVTTIRYKRKVYLIETGLDIKGPDDTRANWFFMNFDVYSDDCEIQQEVVERVLCSFHYFRTGKTKNETEQSKDNNPRLEIFMDSGGFQFASGKTTYIDLKELARVYKKHATRALTLDIPPTDDDLLNYEVMKVLAIAQRENTESLLARLPKGFPLYSTIHGLDFESQLRWLKFVRNLAVNNYAIPLRKRYDQFFSFIPIIAHLIVNEKAESIHLLGVAFDRIIPLLCVIGKYVAISSDANSILKNTYEFHKYLHYTGDGRIHEFPIGQRNGSFDYSGTGITSPCNCPVCQKIPLFEIHQFDEKYRTVPMLLLHNFWHFEKFIAHWNKVVTTKDIAEAAGIYGNTFANRNHDAEELERLMLNVDCYLKLASEKGTEVAYDTFWSYFEDNDVDEGDAAEDDMSALDWELDHEFKSNIHLAKHYLPDSILTEYADLFTETERKRAAEAYGSSQKSTKERKIEDEANDEAFLFYSYLKSHEGLSQRFGLDIVEFWACLRDITYDDDNRQCLLNPEHQVDLTEVEVGEKLAAVTISCKTCGYSVKFDIETD
jgi:queuine/archaeosine tRNA-ribosyltransferase